VVVAEDHKDEVTFSFFDEILGSPPIHSCAIRLEQLDIPSLNLSCLSDHFTEAKVWAVISALPSDKAPGSDSFTACFLQTSWPIIRWDVIDVFDALWHMDTRNMHDLNVALMVLLPKLPDATAIKDYRLITLIHLIDKLIAMVLSNRIAPELNMLVHCSQSAFINGRCIHDNFQFV
jgi:hypothetical protein